MAEDKRELAESARDLLTDKIFQNAIMRLRKQWVAELMVLEPKVGSAGYLTAMARYVSMVAALEAIPTELQAIINDYRMSKKVG